MLSTNTINQQHTTCFHFHRRTCFSVFPCLNLGSWFSTRFMFSATFPRRGRQPLRIHPRHFRDQPQLLTFSRGHRNIITLLLISIEADDWHCLRFSCCQLFVLWCNPTEVYDPPVALPIGLHSDSGTDSSSPWTAVMIVTLNGMLSHMFLWCCNPKPLHCPGLPFRGSCGPRHCKQFPVQLNHLSAPGLDWVWQIGMPHQCSIQLTMHHAAIRFCIMLIKNQRHMPIQF